MNIVCWEILLFSGENGNLTQYESYWGWFKMTVKMADFNSMKFSGSCFNVEIILLKFIWWGGFKWEIHTIFCQLKGFSPQKYLSTMLRAFVHREKNTKKCLCRSHACVYKHMALCLCLYAMTNMYVYACVRVCVCLYVCLSANGPRHYWYKHCCIRVDKTAPKLIYKRTENIKKWYNLKVQFTHRHLDDSKLHLFNI